MENVHQRLGKLVGIGHHLRRVLHVPVWRQFSIQVLAVPTQGGRDRHLPDVVRVHDARRAFPAIRFLHPHVHDGQLQLLQILPGLHLATDSVRPQLPDSLL